MTETSTPEQPAAATPGSPRPEWKDGLERFERPRLPISLLDLATSVVPYLALFAAMYLAFDVSYWLVLALAIPASGFLLRTYILFHDCAHGNFLATKRANTWLGRVLGLIVYTPYLGWRHSHAVHHATAGDLDRRGVGDVPTMTLAEYQSAPWGKRLAYRLFRNPLVMFGIGPFYALVLQPRLVSKDARPRIRRSVHVTNAALALTVGAMCLLLGWKEFLLIQAPLVLIAGGAGVWLFYVQHQFEDTYWKDAGDWSYTDAALRGSSYLKLPQPFQFFTGNIGLHHVHHLSAKIPNYNLQAAHDANPIFHRVPQLSAWDGLKATRLKLWDEDSGRLLTWAEVRRQRTGAPASSGVSA